MAHNSRPFPTTFADLTLRDDTACLSLYQSIKEVRKSTLSISNRLKSIVRDAQFVQDIARNYCLPIIANERCGSWYIDPRFKNGSAYFKSTDGHYGQWSFSLRRLNLQLLSTLGQHGGAILVDSTRRGKNMPDAFLKTVPIWVAVMNQALFPGCTESHALQCPPWPDNLGRSEISQIEAKIHGFVMSFEALQLDMQSLTTTLCKPILIQWKVNGSEAVNRTCMDLQLKPADERNYNRLVLCSASRRVVGAEVSEGGYIQGAGDDSESWAYDLTPELFWQYQNVLLQETTEEELLETIGRLIAENAMLPSSSAPGLISPTSSLYIGPRTVEGKEKFDLLIDCTTSGEASNKIFFGVGCREGKLGSRDLRDKLQGVREFVKAALLEHGPRRILVTCPSCKDLSAGVALMLLCLFYNETGGQEIGPDLSQIDKTLIKKRFAWISSSIPSVNASRATLQSVNAFLMPR